MSSTRHKFIFASLDSKQPTTARKVHIRRLFDILHLSIQQNEYDRAKRVWAVLIRCPEVNWRSMWPIGLQILAGTNQSSSSQSAEYLRSIMLQYPDDRESILKELIFCLIQQGRHRDALEELDLYLPSFPYQDNPTFHLYAGLLRLYLAQTPSQSQSQSQSKDSQYDLTMLNGAQTHFTRAQQLDESNPVASAFLAKITDMRTGKPSIEDDSEAEESAVSDSNDYPQAKRHRS